MAASLGGFDARVAIERARPVTRYEFVRKIARDALARALPWRADAAAARREHHQPIVRRHALETLAAHLQAGFQPDVTRGPMLPAVAPACRMIDAVERRQDVPRPIDAAADLD